MGSTTGQARWKALCVCAGSVVAGALARYLSEAHGWEAGDYEVVSVSPVPSRASALSSNPLDVSTGYLGLYEAEVDFGGRRVRVEFDPDLVDEGYEADAYFGGDDYSSRDVEESIMKAVGDAAREAGAAPSSVRVQLMTTSSSAGTKLTYPQPGAASGADPFGAICYGPWGATRALYEQRGRRWEKQGGCSVYLVFDDPPDPPPGLAATLDSLFAHYGAASRPAVTVWAVRGGESPAGDGDGDFGELEDRGEIVWTSTGAPN